MEIAAITKNEKYTGDHLLIIPKREMQNLSNILTTYCDEHKRAKSAKKIRDQFDNLEIW